jgi:hypothetical protein
LSPETLRAKALQTAGQIQLRAEPLETGQFVIGFDVVSLSVETTGTIGSRARFGHTLAAHENRTASNGASTRKLQKAATVSIRTITFFFHALPPLNWTDGLIATSAFPSLVRTSKMPLLQFP